MARSKSKTASKGAGIVERAAAAHPEEPSWADVAAASGEAQASTSMGGVAFDGGGPVYLVELTQEERAAAATRLTDLMVELDDLRDNMKAAAAEARKDLKMRQARIDALRDEIRSGTRKESAQQTLPV